MTIETILIVDDEPDNLTLLEKRLRAAGFKTLRAANGEEALDIAREFLPDLILLDLMMPGLSGYDIARLLQRHPETAEIPYIFLTARSEVDSRVSGLSMGAADYIIKPFHFKELLARIINILRNRDHLKNLREENIRLQQLSIVDHLTGLYNKKYFLERLNEEVSRASRYKYPLACVMMDIDYFKRINDSYGHLAGDRILMDLADMIKESTRVVDVAARFGGEEFVILLPQTNTEGGLYVAEKIRINIANHHFRDGEKRIRLSISAGVSCHTGSEDIVPESLIHQADVALYEAKNHGRNNTRLYRN